MAEHNEQEATANLELLKSWLPPEAWPEPAAVAREQMLGERAIRLCDQQSSGREILLTYKDASRNEAGYIHFGLVGWSNQQEIPPSTPVRIRVKESTLSDIKPFQPALLLGPSLMGVQLGEEHDGEIRRGCEATMYPLEFTQADHRYIERMDANQRQMEQELHRLERHKNSNLWYWVDVLKDKPVTIPPVLNVYSVNPLTGLQQPIAW